MRTLYLCLAALAASASALAQTTVPPAPTLSAGPDFKGLQFDWEPIASASRYELEYRAHQTGPFVRLGRVLPASTTSFRYRFPLHLFNWTYVRYRLAACNSAGCSRSEEISVSSHRKFAVGYFKASQSTVGLQFGQDTDISPDGANVAATAPGAIHSSGVASGAVYVFRRGMGGAWSQRAKLEPPAPFSVDDWYRSSVAISADGNTVVMSMPGYFDQEADQHSGEVFVFRFNGTSWVRTRLSAGTRGHFGRWMGMNDAGDIIAVASGESFTPALPRRVFIYRLTNGTWQPVRAISDTYPERCDRGVLSNDGSTIAETCTGPGGANGITFVRTHSGPNWTERADLELDTGEFTDWGHDHGGIGIDASGDTIAAQVSVNHGRDPDIGPSEVHVFRRTGGVHAKVAELTTGPWRNVDGIRFYGLHLAVSGDGATIAVGDARDNGLGNGPRAAPLNPGDAQTGAIYVYRLGSTWRLANMVKPNYTPGGTGSLTFGIEVALNGNGQTLIVGDYLENSGAQGIGGDWSNSGVPQSGAVWMY